MFYQQRPKTSRPAGRKPSSAYLFLLLSRAPPPPIHGLMRLLWLYFPFGCTQKQRTLGLVRKPPFTPHLSLNTSPPRYCIETSRSVSCTPVCSSIFRALTHLVTKEMHRKISVSSSSRHGIHN